MAGLIIAGNYFLRAGITKHSFFENNKIFFMEEYFQIPTPNGIIAVKLEDLLKEHENDKDPFIQEKSAQSREMMDKTGFPEGVIEFLNARKKEKENSPGDNS